VTDTKWMTYAEIAELLGIGADSARNLVRRRRWPRQAGNDGLARIGVPVEYLDENAKADGPIDPPADPPADSPTNGTIDGGHVISILTSHINRLEREMEALREDRDAERRHREAERNRLQSEIEVLRSERDAERLRASQIDVLNAIIEVGHKRVDDISANRDTLASQIESLNALVGLERKRAEADRIDLRADRDRWMAQAEKLAVLAPAPVAPAAQPQGWWPWKRRA
jgi:outer membrane murein-binding lipoprotein Lpp